MTDETQWDAFSLEQRRKHFQFVVQPSRFTAEEWVLQYTTNGHQWYAVNLRAEEWQQITAALVTQFGGAPR